jgi:nitrite reductase/ring-hydroxylating ferredoxin subunit
MAWLPVADVLDFADKNVMGTECAGKAIAVYKVEDGYYATSNICTHAGALLSEGDVVEGLIECPLHFGLFEILTGKAQGAPVTRDLKTYPVRVNGSRVEIELHTDRLDRAHPSAR